MVGLLFPDEVVLDEVVFVFVLVFVFCSDDESFSALLIAVGEVSGALALAFAFFLLISKLRRTYYSIEMFSRSSKDDVTTGDIKTKKNSSVYTELLINESFIMIR